MTNFCKLPPDRDRAADCAEGVRTSKVSITSCAKARARGQSRKPERLSSLRTIPVSMAFSVRLISGAAAWPKRSSGAAKSPKARRAFGAKCPMPIALSLIRSCGRSTSPDRQATSSSCPLPATPPIPKTSPLRREKDMFFRLVPKVVCGASERSATSSTTSPSALSCGFAELSVPPTIISANARADFSRGSHVAILRPARKMVAVSHRSRISSSLWEM